MQFVANRPSLPAGVAARIVDEVYGIAGLATPLPGERDQNVLISAPSGERFVFKIGNQLETRELLDAQQAALALLARAGAPCPRVVRSRKGEEIVEIAAPNGERYAARLLTYLPGVPLARVERRSAHLYESLGRSVGTIDRALASFDHPALRRSFHWDLVRGLDVVRERTSLLADDELRAQIQTFASRIEGWLDPLVPKLRTAAVHGDANDHNVLVEECAAAGARVLQVSGILDLGDMIYTWVASDPAIAIAYAMLDDAEPLAASAHVLRGYHAEYALLPAEIAAIFPLACLRLCASACIAAEQQRQHPEDDYLGVSQAAIRTTLPSLARVPFPLAEATLRAACGLSAVPRSDNVVRALTSSSAAIAPVLDVDPRTEPIVVFDLGVASPLTAGAPEDHAEPRLTSRLFSLMRERGARVGVGRYDEARALYSGAAFASESDQQRTVHLGIDLFAEPGTRVHAPLAGIVHALHDNDAPQDYGPVVILRHEAPAAGTFFTLYGHLSRESLRQLEVGRQIAAGEAFATLGAPHENGGWTPHVHVQLIVDLMDLGWDFPGVCRASERDVWCALSPDPNVIVRVPRDAFPPAAPSRERTLTRRRARLGPNLSIAYRDPVRIVRGWMQYLWDDTGRRFLDAYNNVPHVGHCHPAVVKAGQDQMAVLNTNTRYLHDRLVEYAERVAATLPAPLSVCYFVNSASEANELALRLARAFTRQRDVIVLEAAYHGHTTSLIDISPYKHAGPGGRGAPSWVHVVPVPDLYRGLHRRDDPESVARYASYVEAVVERLGEAGRAPAAFIAETCPSVAGQLMLPEGYLSRVYSAVRSAGGICIADEVQTGYGRLGTHFWAFEAHRVVPDVVVMGKPIGNGHPIGAVVTTPDIAAAFDNGMEFFSTFGGNTVSCAIGLAVLDVVQRQHLQQHAREVGEYLLEGLRGLAARYPLCGDVRGSGLFVGLELTRDPRTLAPATEQAAVVVEGLRRRGVLAGTDGPFHNVIKIRPPMPFTRADADTVVGALDDVLRFDVAS